MAAVQASPPFTLPQQYPSFSNLHPQQCPTAPFHHPQIHAGLQSPAHVIPNSTQYSPSYPQSPAYHSSPGFWGSPSIQYIDQTQADAALSPPAANHLPPPATTGMSGMNQGPGQTAQSSSDLVRGWCPEQSSTPVDQAHYASYPTQAYSAPYAFPGADVKYSPTVRGEPHRPYTGYDSSYQALSHLYSLRSSAHSFASSVLEQSKPNLCTVCGKSYARPSTLKTHMRTHSGEKPFQCKSCKKKFSQAANLTAHMRTHSGEKPFKCLVCDRRFSQSSSVTTHMRTHSGERPYRCRFCKKSFSDSSTLTKHLRIHSGEKPYQCKICYLKFSQSGNLNRHMRVHGQNV